MASHRFWTLAVLAVGFGLKIVTKAVPFSGSTAAIAQTETQTPDGRAEIEAIKGKLPEPFIRVQIPAEPETPIINFDPNATWPR